MALPIGAVAGTTGAVARPTGYLSTWGARPGFTIVIIAFGFNVAEPTYPGFVVARTAVETSSVRCTILLKPAGPAEPATYTRGGGTTYVTYCCAVDTRGVVPLPVGTESHSSAANGTTGVVSGAAVAANKQDSLLFLGGGIEDMNTTITTATGMTQLAAPDDDCAAFYRVLRAVGTTGSQATNGDAATNWCAAMFALDIHPERSRPMMIGM